MARKQQTPAVAPAAPVARKGKAQAQQPEAQQPEAQQPEAQQDRPLSQWASERARAMQGEGRAAARFDRLAVALQEFADKGKGKPVTVRFAEVNAATGDRRGEGATDASARWVSALAKLRQLSGGVLPGFDAKVDREAGAIVVQATAE